MGLFFGNVIEWFKQFLLFNSTLINSIDKRLAWIDNITSTELANLFSSFNVYFGMDQLRCSFDCKDLLENLKSEITSLAENVVLTIEGDQRTDTKLLRVLVFEVIVDTDGEEFCVLEKVYTNTLTIFLIIINSMKLIDELIKSIAEKNQFNNCILYKTNMFILII